MELLNGVDVGTVLAIAAHPDDIEYEASAAVALWTGQGCSVAYLLVTRGEAGIENMSAEKCAAVRSEEQRASAAVVGVSEVQFLDHPDGVIALASEIEHDLIRVIRRQRPDTVLMTNHHPTWPSGASNSVDHQRVGIGVINAVREVNGDPDRRHKIQRILVAGSTKATHGLDVSATIGLAVQSLAQHSTYLASLCNDEMSDPNYVRREMERVGGEIGFQAAIAFELIEM